MRRALLALLFIATGATAQYPVWSALHHGVATGHNVVASGAAVAASSGGKVAVATAFANQFDGHTSWRIASYAAATGKLEWQTVQRMSDSDRPYAVAFDLHGDVIVTGSSGAEALPALLTLKLRGNDGALVWIGEPIPAPAKGISVECDAAGDVVVLSADANAPQASRIAKYAGADGRLRWERAAGGALAIALAASGDVLAAGARTGTYPASDVYVARFASGNGALAWERTWTAPGGTPATATAIARDASGDAFIAGSLASGALLAQKVAGATGSLLWSATVETGLSGERAHAVGVDGAGNPVLLADYGHTTKFSGANGAVVWDRNEQPPYAVLQTGMRIDRDGSVIVVGQEYTTARIRKLHADGTLAWMAQRESMCCNALALADDDAPIVAVNVGNSYESDVVVARLDPAVGATTWASAPTSGPAETEAGFTVPPCCDPVPARARSIAVDAVGNVLVAGTSYNGAGTSIEVVKRRAQDGAPLWARSIDYGPGIVANATAIAIDRNGNPVVAAVAWRNTPPDSTAWHVVKLDGSDGTLAWDRALADKAGPIVQPHAIAIDGAGNLFLTGTTYASEGIHMRTVRLAASDGGTVWDRSFATPGASQDVGRTIAIDAGGDVIVAGEFDGFALTGATQAIKYRGSDGTVLWRAVVEGNMDRGGGMAVDATGDVTVAAVYGSALTLGASRLSGVSGAQVWRQPGFYAANFAPSALALDGAGNAVLVDAGFGGLQVRKLAAASGTLVWESSMTLDAVCNMWTTGGIADGNGDIYAAVRVAVRTGPDCAGPAYAQHLVKLQSGDGAVVADRVLADADALYALAARGEHVYLAGRGSGADGLPGLQVVKVAGTPQATLAGKGTVIANPYGTLSVQGATLIGNAITQWQPVATVELGATDAGPGSFAQIDFAGLGVPAGGVLTVRSNAAHQSVVLANVDDSVSVIRGTLRAEGANGAPPPMLHVHNRNGIVVDPGGAIVAAGGAIVDALAATADSGSDIVNGGRIDGGPSLALFAGGVHGGGVFAGNDVLLSTFGNANEPAHGAFFLGNGLRIAPATGSAVTVTANLYGAAPQFVNLAVAGDLVFALPSAWAPGVALPPNNAVVPPGGSRPAGVANPRYGGGSIIVQASGRLALASPVGDLAFPGGIVLKAGTAIDFAGVRVDQGWTTSGQPFQGLFFEAPAIGNAQGPIELYSNQLNWSNFSTFPSASVRAFTLQRNGDGSASHAPADAVAPHLNTYSVLIDAAARGQCWTCLQSTQPVDMSGP